MSLQGFDDRILDWFRHSWNPKLDSVMFDLSALGGRAVLTVIVLFTVGLLIAVRRQRTAAFVLAAALGGALLVATIKQRVGRPRPEPQHPGVYLDAGSRSFPSGHSMLSAVIYLTLAEIAAPLLPRRRVRVYVISASLILVFLVGVSRLYLCVHYPTDVVAGWAVGLIWAIACRKVEARWVLRAERRAAVLETEIPEGG
jgi:undecaprenyl-diphosphatase